MTRVTAVSVLFSLAILVYVLEMVRRRRLREEYSILWIFGGLVILVLSIRQDWLNRVSRLLGIAYPPSFLFLVGILFMLFILVHFSIAVSKLYQMNKRTAQELALLKKALEEGRSPGDAPE